MPVTEPLAAASLDTETLEALLKQVRPRLKQVLKKYDIPFQDAEDLLQEACLDLCRKWETIRTKDAWLLGTVRFLCSKYWKKKRAENVQAFDLPTLNEISPPQAPEQERTEVRHDLRVLIRGLDERHLAILYLRFGLGLSTAEVALRLGYCSSSIRKLAGRSLARLQRWAADPSAQAASAPNDTGDPPSP